MSKRLTYPLLAITLIVWGLIAYKIFFYTPQEPSPSRKESKGNVRIAQQEASLLFNYRDPFLGDRKPENTNSEENIKKTVEKPALPKTEKKREQLGWQGKITSKKKEYYLISIDNIHYMVAQGEEVGGYKIHRTYNDSIVLKKEGELFTLKRN